MYHNDVNNMIPAPAATPTPKDMQHFQIFDKIESQSEETI